METADRVLPRETGSEHWRPPKRSSGSNGVCGRWASRRSIRSPGERPRLYVKVINEMIDTETVRFDLSTIGTRARSVVELVRASIALGLLAAYLALVGRGLAGVLIAAATWPLCFSSARTSTGRLAARSGSPTPLTEQLS